MTDLLKKGEVLWTREAQNYLMQFKEIMTTCPVLALSDFTKPFELQCDASREGVSVVLIQDKHPIAYESNKLRGLERSFNIYDNKMLAIMHALAKFR